MPEDNAQWDLKKGHLYQIRSRNLPYGVYDGRGGFIGIREKFASLFLFTEYDWDNGPPFGTVTVQEDLGPTPEDIEPVEAWWVHGDTRWPSGTPIPEQARGKENVREHGHLPNQALYDFLARAEHEYGRGEGYGGRPGDPDMTGAGK